MIYNKRLSESVTLRALLRVSSELKKSVNLVIHNNGPHSVVNEFNDFEKKGFLSVKLTECTSNKALSQVYNEFFNENKNYNEMFILLDDDSEITEPYLNHVINKSCDTLVYYPRLHNSTGKKINPAVRKSNKEDSFTCTDTIFTITSGLAIGLSFCNQIIEKYGNLFDDRFFFYGVDTSFSMRVMAINFQKHIRVIPGFKHSLSNEDATFVQSKFRVKESSYACGLIYHYYFRLRYFPDFMSIFINRFRGVGYISLKYFLLALLKGKHYRDK